MEEHDEFGETWVPISQDMVGLIIGKGGQNIKHITEVTDTRIRKLGNMDDEYAYFVIEGDRSNQYWAKLKIKRTVNNAKKRNEALTYSWFPFVDGEEDSYELQRCDFQGYKSKLVLKSPIKDYNGRGNYDLLLQELSNILQKNQDDDRENVIWCHFGKIYIRDHPEVTEYSLAELERYILPRRVFAPEDKKWGIRFFSGIANSPNKLRAFRKWVYSSSIHTSYKRCDITYLTPSCNEIRVKVFMFFDKSEGVYRNSRCHQHIHEIHNVILSSEAPPYFYICESTYRTGLVDVFQPSSHTDFRLIVEANRRSFPEYEEIHKEAKVFFDYVKTHLQTTEEGDVILPKENCPPHFDESYSRTSFRNTYRIFSSDEVNITARMSSSEDINCIFHGNVQHGDLDIHLEIEDCHNMTPEQILHKVPQLMNCARDLARVLTIADENEEPVMVPPEILARGPQAQITYKQALKKGKIKNRRVPVVLVGQARSGKTSLLRSLNGEEFNPFEDSTIGANLQRCLSKVEDSVWETTPNNEDVLFNQCVSVELAKNLSSGSPLHDQEINILDSEDDYRDFEVFRNDNTVETDLTEHQSNDTNTDQVDQTTEYMQQNTEMAAKTTTITMESVQIQDEIQVSTDLSSEIVSFTASILENSNDENQIKNNLFFDTMDFAGQAVYSVTHPVFLPPRATYLLVHSLENALHEQSIPIVRSGAAERKIDEHYPLTNLDHLKFWLSLIAANSTQERCSPVFLVSTHADKVSKDNALKTTRETLALLKEKHFLPGQHLELEIYTVDNTVSGKASPEDPGISKLKADLREKVNNLPQCKEDIPIRWLRFEKELKRLRNKGKKEMSPKEVETIATRCEVLNNELETLLHYMHDLKVIIHFPETNTIIIDTQWLLDMFARVITVQPIECHKGYEDEWRRLEHEGVVDIQFLKHLWKDLLNDDTSVESLINIMEKFALVCKQQDGSLLVPAMLLNSNTAESWDDIMKEGRLPSPLVIRFDSSHLPFGLFPRLVIAVDKMCHSQWKGLETPNLSQNCARFYIDIDGVKISLVFMSDTSSIAVVLILKDQNHSHLCQIILKLLRETLDDMLQSFPWMKTLRYDFCIRCPICVCSSSCKEHNKIDCHRDSCVHLIPERELLNPEPRCQRRFTKINNEIPIDTYSHWFPRSRLQEGKQEAATDVPTASCISLTREEDDQCKELIPLLENMSISTQHATEKSKEIAARLGLDKHSVQDPPDEIRQKSRACYKFLLAKREYGCIEALKNELPCGMTGPLEPGILVKDMDSRKKDKLSKVLTVREMEWKAFAKEQVGLSTEDIEFLHHREKNPVFEILNKYCGDWTLDHLYNALVHSGSSAIADKYL